MSGVLSSRRQSAMLLCGVVLFFFTSMSKVLVPGLIFGDLQLLGLGAGAIGSLGAAYMWSYSLSQLGAGAISSRWSGAKLLLWGGGAFVLGSLIFPLSSAYWLLLTARILAGLGAGTVCLGVIKLISELFPERFGLILSIVMFLGYLGPITGMSPMTWVIGAWNWRGALLLPAVISAAAVSVIFLTARREARKVGEAGNSGSLSRIFRSADNLRLFAASAVIFGAYYAVLTVAGQKCLQDSCGMSRMTASFFITCLAVLVAVCNLLTDAVLKWSAGRRKRLLTLAAACSLAGAVLGLAAFQLHWSAFFVAVSFVLLALPAGGFSVYSVIAREFNPPDLLGPSVALLNFSAFVMIALDGQLAGMLMSRYEAAAQRIGGAAVYPAAAYRDVFLLFTFLALVGLACARFIREPGVSKR